MDKIKQQIESFDSKILNAHKQVQNVICKISDADKQIHTYIQNFRDNIHKIILIKKVKSNNITNTFILFTSMKEITDMRKNWKRY